MIAIDCRRGWEGEEGPGRGAWGRKGRRGCEWRWWQGDDEEEEECEDEEENKNVDDADNENDGHNEEAKEIKVARGGNNGVAIMYCKKFLNSKSDEIFEAKIKSIIPKELSVLLLMRKWRS